MSGVLGLIPSLRIGLFNSRHKYQKSADACVKRRQVFLSLHEHSVDEIVPGRRA